MVGLRGRRLVEGGGGRGHNLNRSLTVNNVQYTQECIRTAARIRVFNFGMLQSAVHDYTCLE